MLLMQAGEVSFSSVTVIRPPALPAPRPHLQANYQWALTSAISDQNNPSHFQLIFNPNARPNSTVDYQLYKIASCT